MQVVGLQLILLFTTFSTALSAVPMSVRELLLECHPFQAELTKHLRGVEEQESNFVIRGNQALIFGAGYMPGPFYRLATCGPIYI